MHVRTGLGGSGWLVAMVVGRKDSYEKVGKGVSETEWWWWWWWSGEGQDKTRRRGTAEMRMVRVG